MIQNETILSVIDNSGAKKVKCIRILGGSKRKIATLGDTIVVSVQQTHPLKKNPKVKRGQVVRAIVVGVKKPYIRITGEILRVDSSYVVLINEKNELIGTRISGPIAGELRNSNHLKLLSLATRII